MKPEPEYLRRIVSSYVNRADVPEPSASLDWKRLHDLTIAHRLLLPIVAQSLHQIARTPAWLLEKVEREVRHYRVSFGCLQGELNRIMTLLGSRDITPLLLKGAALASTVYRSPLHRVFGDIDLLLPREKIACACDALCSAGYRTGLETREPEYYERFHFHHIFHSPSGRVIELHWDLTGPSSPFRFDLQGIWDRAQHVEFAGVPITVPSNPDHLMITAIQAWDCGFSDIRRTLDAALLIRSGALEDPGIIREVKSAGLETPFWHLVKSSKAHFGVPVSPEVESALCLQSQFRRGLISIPAMRMMWEDPGNREWGGYRLIKWLASGTLGNVAHLVSRYCWPGEEEFMERGFSPQVKPSLPLRLWWSATALISLLKMAAYLIVCRFRGGRELRSD